MEEINQNPLNSQVPTQVYQTINQSSGQNANNTNGLTPILFRYARIILGIVLGSAFGVWMGFQMMRIYNFVPSNFTCLNNVNMNLKIIGVVMAINISGGIYVFLKIAHLLTGRIKAIDLIKNYLFVLIVIFWIIGGLLAIWASSIPPGVLDCPSL